MNLNLETIERKGFGYKPLDYGEDIAEDFEYTIKQNKYLVEEILNTWEKSRDNDVLLYFEFLRTKFSEIEVTSSNDNIIFKFPKKLIKYFNSPETVTRIRRMLNSKGLYLPISKNVFIRRMKRQSSIRNYFNSHTRTTFFLPTEDKPTLTS